TAGPTAIHLDFWWPSAGTQLAAHLDFATAADKAMAWTDLRRPADIIPRATLPVTGSGTARCPWRLHL
ncbi:hypothetical protein, partial [Streptomyces sp. NPDC058424]|uniref:hypothetical protein n=1 Tax=Streptomyces sp. NPDC058424 TaxID=3346491 RepID=UPI0036609BB0